MYVYIKEIEEKEEIEFFEKLPKWAKKSVWKVMQTVNWIITKQIEENRKVYLIPNIENKNTEKRLKRKLEKEKGQTQRIQLVLSKKGKQFQEALKNYKIIEGRRIYEEAIERILEEVLKGHVLEMQDIYILANHYQERNTKIIRELAQKVKSINIITKEIGKYKVLEELMMEEGMVISVANNKRKSLKRAKIILNLDFTKEEINQYTIFRNALIINQGKEKITKIRGLEGIIIQNISVVLEQEEKEWIRKQGLENDFSLLEIYESLEKTGKQKEKIQIDKLYGNHGEISKKELRNWQKILTNEKN